MLFCDKDNALREDSAPIDWGTLPVNLFELKSKISNLLKVTKSKMRKVKSDMIPFISNLEF